MAEPTFMSDGAAARRTDTRWALLEKWLGELQNSLGGGADPANNPSKQDTRHELLEKINRALA